MICTDTCCQPERECDAQIVATTMRRAAKERSCAACGKPIRRGDKYERVAMRFDGTFVAYAQHVGGYCGYPS